jgi:predicted nucleic acid-binding protein
LIVIDASALLDLLLRTSQTEELQRRVFEAARGNVNAPHLADLEVAQVLRRYVAKGDVTEERATEALTDLADLAIRRYPHRLLLTRVWELRNNFSAYDAVYVALAEALEASLLTRDRRLAAAAKNHVQVEVL